MSDALSDCKPQVKLDPAIDFIAGTVAGMAGLVVGFPFDTVKVRFQSPEISQKYRSTLHAITTIIREERFSGLYKGISSPLATAAFLNGLVFSSYRFLMKIQLDRSDSIPTLTQVALAGTGSGIVSSIITTPTELIKIRQQYALNKTSAPTVALQILRRSGMRGLYRGITATALRDCGYGAYFAAYEATCRYFTPPKPSSLSTDHSSILSEVDTEINNLPWFAMLIAGGVAGIAGWIGTFPLDVVKTRVQGSQWSPPPTPETRFSVFPTPPSSPILKPTCQNPYRTTLSTAVVSYRTEGLGVFFRGLGPTLIRAVPVNMMTFATFELIVHTIGT